MDESASPLIIPTPNEFAERNGYNPFPPRWESWLLSVRSSILTAQPQSGRNTSVDVHPGKGTMVNAVDNRGRAGGGGGGCACDGTTPITAIFSGIIVGCGCLEVSPGDHRILIDIDVNGTFVVPNVAPGVWILDTAAGNVEEHLYGAVECTGDFETAVQPCSIVIECPFPGFWRISYVANNFPLFCAIIEDLCATSTGIANQLSCGIDTCAGTGVPVAGIGGTFSATF